MGSTPTKPSKPTEQQVAPPVVPAGVDADVINGDSLVLRLPEQWELTDRALSEIAGLNDLLFERTAEGDLVVTLPPLGRAPRVGVEISAQIRNWMRDGGGGGEAADSSGGFRLDDGDDDDPEDKGTIRVPDVSWMSSAQVASVDDDEIDRQYLRLCPEFVVEIVSAGQQVAQQQARMTEWMGFGARLGWLIDPQRNKAWVYRAGRDEPEELDRPQSLSGEDVLNGFDLDCSYIWR